MAIDPMQNRGETMSWQVQYFLIIFSNAPESYRVLNMLYANENDVMSNQSSFIIHNPTGSKMLFFNHGSFSYCVSI